jgi:3-hydroxybutyryl-CoA dehydratase
MIKRNYEDIKIGEKRAFSKTITESDVFAFAGICGDFNPLHVDEEFAKKSMFKGRIAHGMLSASLLCNTASEILGLGGVHIWQSVRFKAPVKLGDTITAESEVTDLKPEKRRIIAKSTMTNQDGVVVLTGEGEYMLP